MVSAATSVNEEPQEGKLHAGDLCGRCRVTGIPTASTPVTMKKYLILFALLFSSSYALAGAPFLGHFTTVTESQCNNEIVLLINGFGTFIDTCRGKDGSHVDDVEKFGITWKQRGNVIIVTIKGSKEKFEYIDALSCSDFGAKGSTNGLVSYGIHFWRYPIKCK